MKPPSVPVSLPDKIRERDLNVKPQTLVDYDQLGQQKDPQRAQETQDSTEDKISTDPALCQGDKSNDRDN